MFDFLSSFVEVLVTVFNFVVDAFTSVLDFLTFAPAYFDYFKSVLSFIPAFMFPFFLVIFLIALIWFLKDLISL